MQTGQFTQTGSQKLTSGDPNSFVAQVFELLNDVLQKHSRSQLSGTPNGNQPTITPAQFVALKTQVEALPGKQDLQSFQAELVRTIKAREGTSTNADPAIVRELEEILKLLKSGVVRSVENPVTKWAKTLGLWATIALAGWVACFINLQHQVSEVRREAAEQIERIIATKPIEARFTSSLWARGGGTPIIETIVVDGRDALLGIVIPPGTMTFGKPFIADKGKPGAAVVPLQ